MATYEEVLSQIEGIRTEVLPEANTSTRVGGAMKEMLDFGRLENSRVIDLVKAEEAARLRTDTYLLSIIGGGNFFSSFKGAWSSDVEYVRESHELLCVTHLGCLWYLLMEKSKGDEPLPTSQIWGLMIGVIDMHLEFTNPNNFILLQKNNVKTTVSLHVMLGNTDITDVMLDKAYYLTWERDSGVLADDKAWKPVFVDEKDNILDNPDLSSMKNLLLVQDDIKQDLGINWANNGICKFYVTIGFGGEPLKGTIII